MNAFQQEAWRHGSKLSISDTGPRRADEGDAFGTDLDEALAHHAAARPEPPRHAPCDAGTQAVEETPRVPAPTARPLAPSEPEPPVELTEEELRLLLGQEGDA